jgi:FkbM family methyltransferase
MRPGIDFEIDPVAREGFEAYCWWWPEMVDELNAFLATSRAKRTLIDVGALHGLFSLAFVHGRNNVRAIAIEPGTSACEVVDAHMRMNRIDNITLLRTAVSDRSGELAMVARGPHMETVTAEATQSDLDRAVSYQVTTIDRICDEINIRPDLLKIDVEGYELNVLRGSERVLREDGPTIFLELHPGLLANFGQTPAELLTFLAALGYRFHSLRGDLIPRDRIESSLLWSHLICDR